MKAIARYENRESRIGSERQDAMTSIYPQRVRLGPFEADLETHALWKNGIKVKLGGQPFKILAVLLNRPGQLVTREELQKEIWAADAFVDFNHGLNAAVNKLRDRRCQIPPGSRNISRRCRGEATGSSARSRMR